MPHERVVLVYLLTARPCASASCTDLHEQGSLQTIGNGTHLTRAIQGGVLANCFSGMQWSALLRWYVKRKPSCCAVPTGRPSAGSLCPWCMWTTPPNQAQSAWTHWCLKRKRSASSKRPLQPFR